MKAYDSYLKVSILLIGVVFSVGQDSGGVEDAESVGFCTADFCI